MQRQPFKKVWDSPSKDKHLNTDLDVDFYQGSGFVQFLT